VRLSTVIVNWNTSRLLDACLEAIYRHAPELDFEVIVVDNASADFDEAAFRSRSPQARLIVNETNVGYARANNQAIADSSGEYVLLLNADTEVTEGALSRLVGFMDAHPEAAAAGCRLVRPDGTLERSCRSFPEPASVAAEFFRLSRLFPRSRRFGAYRMTWFGYDEEALVDQPMGSCLILSRKAIGDVGVFDEDFPIFFNDVDWCYRARQAGWKVYFTPAAEVIHHGAASTSQVRAEMRRESHRSLARFYRKHYRGKLFPPIYWLIVAAIRLSQGSWIMGHGSWVMGNARGAISNRQSAINNLHAPCPMPHDLPDITVSVVSWNTRAELARCLESVMAQEGTSFEVIVVDNASSDGSAALVREAFPQVTLIANDRNVGFSRAHNQSLELGRGRYFMLLNPDALLPERDTLARLVAFADANPEVGIVGPRIENPDGTLQLSARRFPTISAGIFRRTPFGKLFPRNRFVREYVMSDWAHDEVRDVDWVSGSALVIRRKVIGSVGGLDPGFFMYCEDVDWAYRARRRGWRVCYYPMARVVHRIGAASDQAPIRMISQFHLSMFRFYLKHYAKGWRGLLAPAVLVGLAARAVFFMILTRVPISKEALNGGERLVR
jgi:hypothetical protein